MLNFLAQLPSTATTQAAEPWWAGAIHNPMAPIILMVAVMYLFIFRGNKSKDKDRKKMLDQLSKGDRIQTIGGILGTVVEAREADVLIKVDESSNTKIRFLRSAIHRVLEDGKPVDPTK